MSTLSLRPPVVAVRRPWGRWSPWFLAAATLGIGLGLAAASRQTAVALGLMLAPALVALVMHPAWLPGVLAASVFGEAVLAGSVTLSRLAGPLAVLMIVLALPGRRRLCLPRASILVVVTGYSIWAFASVLWTVNSDSSLSAGGTGYALSSLALSLVYTVALAMFVQTGRDVRRLLVMVWLFSVLTGLVSIGQYLSGYTRAFGLAGDANLFAALQVIALPIGAVLATQVRRTGTRLIVLAGLAVSVGSIVTSLSRGGLLGLVAVCVMLAFQPASAFFRTAARKRAFLLVVAVGAGAVLAASFSALSARTTSADGGSGRTNLWRAALSGWRSNPVTGMGFGAFVGESNRLLLQTPGVDFSDYQLRPGGQVVHSAYLESLAELGVVGLALFLAVLGTMARTLVRTARSAARAGDMFLSSVARALLLSVAGYAITSIFLSTETDRSLWILVGLSLALPRVVLNEQRLRTITGERGPGAVQPADASSARRPGFTQEQEA